MAKYDFLIVGAGLFGAICARLLNDKGYKVLIIEKDSIVGGLAKTKVIDDVVLYLNGKHIFYTDDKVVWDFVNQYSEFIDYSNYSEMIQKDGKLYRYPIDLNTISGFSGEIYPEKIRKSINKDIKTYGSQYNSNLEERAISEYGFESYDKILKPYLEKFWGRECVKLSPYIIEDNKNRYRYNDRYYNYKYVGIPKEGYTKLVENIIGDDIDIMLNTDYFEYRDSLSKNCTYTIFTGPIDRFCKYIYGPLDWNCLKFELKEEKDSKSNIFGTPVLNIADKDNALLQLIEHKAFIQEDKEIEKNYITYVYPDKWDVDKECMFSINNDQTEEILDKYIEFMKNNFENIIFGGRQGMYRNISMAQSVRCAIDLCNEIIVKESEN